LVRERMLNNALNSTGKGESSRSLIQAKGTVKNRMAGGAKGVAFLGNVEEGTAGVSWTHKVAACGSIF